VLARSSGRPRTPISRLCKCYLAQESPSHNPNQRMYCPDCQKDVDTYPNSHSPGISHCAQCRHALAANRMPQPPSDQLQAFEPGTSKLDSDAGFLPWNMQWQIDADLSRGERILSAWRGGNASMPRALDSRRHRVDLPARIDDTKPPGDAVRSSRGAHSVVSVFTWEIMTVAVLTVLVIVAAQATPPNTILAATALVGAAAVLLRMFVRWKSQQQHAERHPDHRRRFRDHVDRDRSDIEIETVINDVRKRVGLHGQSIVRIDE
jgi:hypothetical protein